MPFGSTEVHKGFHEPLYGCIRLIHFLTSIVKQAANTLVYNLLGNLIIIRGFHNVNSSTTQFYIPATTLYISRLDT